MTRKLNPIAALVVSSVDSLNNSGTIVTTIALQPPCPRLQPERWTAQQSASRFAWYLSRNKFSAMEMAAMKSIELGCFDVAIKRCLRGKRPNISKLQALLGLWNNRGLSSIPRSLGDKLCLFSDAIRYFSPPYGGPRLTLYRGQSLERHRAGQYGIAWTGRLEIAEKFARLRSTSGVVLRVDAEPRMIVACLAEHICTPKTEKENEMEFEDEYILDPRLLPEKVSVVCLP